MNSFLPDPANDSIVIKNNDSIDSAIIVNDSCIKNQKRISCGERILVVGTTSDYIHWIDAASPGRSLFITDPEIRAKAKEPPPDPENEVLVSLSDETVVRQCLMDHMNHYGQKAVGVACFDCEAMPMASVLARELGLEYASPEVVRNVRDKSISKALWHAAGVPCPATVLVNSTADALTFLNDAPFGMVLKPIAGSGSELVFLCRTPVEVVEAFETIREGLEKRAANPLFQSGRIDLMLAEEMIPGDEFSCDFILENKGLIPADAGTNAQSPEPFNGNGDLLGSDGVKGDLFEIDDIALIRVTRKIKFPHHPFGTIAGYAIVPDPAKFMDVNRLKTTLLEGAKAVGLTRGIAMADIVLKGRIPYLIEMTPRPGGDCIPFLTKQAGGPDVLEVTMDLAQGRPFLFNESPNPSNRSVLNRIKRSQDAFPYKSPLLPLVGVRIFAPSAGIVKRIDIDAIDTDDRVREIRITRQPGHEVILPPIDYDSRLLGHVIFAPRNGRDPDRQSLEICRRVHVEMMHPLGINLK